MWQNKKIPILAYHRKTNNPTQLIHECSSAPPRYDLLMNNFHPLEYFHSFCKCPHFRLKNTEENFTFTRLVFILRFYAYFKQTMKPTNSSIMSCLNNKTLQTDQEGCGFFFLFKHHPSSPMTHEFTEISGREKTLLMRKLC
jgi:hypothetical protein